MAWTLVVVDGTFVSATLGRCVGELDVATGSRLISCSRKRPPITDGLLEAAGSLACWAQHRQLLAVSANSSACALRCFIFFLIDRFRFVFVSQTVATLVQECAPSRLCAWAPLEYVRRPINKSKPLAAHVVWGAWARVTGASCGTCCLWPDKTLARLARRTS